MSIELTPDSIDVKEPSFAPPFPASRWGRILYGLFVTILPAFSFWATDLLKPEWQNGKLSSYVILSLFPEASLLFFPLLAYSIICYLLLLSAPSRFSTSLVVRTGIYTGFLLALHYSIVVLVYSLDTYIYVVVPIWIFSLLYLPIYRWTVSRWSADRVHGVLFVLLLCGLIIVALVMRQSTLVLILVLITMAAPIWCFLLALRASIWLYKNYETKFILPRGLGLTAWLAAYAVAWRYDILKMYELYAALPPQPPPDCYIATAAARGHPQFVRAWTVKRADGKSMQVNVQLQALKCVELALIATHPRLHTFLRRIYDGVGKPLACRIQNPFLADIAYLLLKPFEWLTRIILKFIVPEIDSISSQLYTK